MTKNYRVYLKADYMGMSIFAADFQTSEASNQMWFRNNGGRIVAIFALDHVEKLQEHGRVVWAGGAQ